MSYMLANIKEMVEFSKKCYACMLKKKVFFLLLMEGLLFAFLFIFFIISNIDFVYEV